MNLNTYDPANLFLQNQDIKLVDGILFSSVNHFYIILYYTKEVS